MALWLLLVSCESVEGTWTGDCALGESSWATEIDVSYQSLGSVEGEFLLSQDGDAVEGEGGGGFDGDQLKMIFQLEAPDGEHVLARVDGVVSDDEMDAGLSLEGENETYELECAYERE